MSSRLAAAVLGAWNAAGGMQLGAVQTGAELQGRAVACGGWWQRMRVARAAAGGRRRRWRPAGRTRGIWYEPAHVGQAEDDHHDRQRVCEAWGKQTGDGSRRRRRCGWFEGVERRRRRWCTPLQRSLSARLPVPRYHAPVAMCHRRPRRRNSGMVKQAAAQAQTLLLAAGAGRASGLLSVVKQLLQVLQGCCWAPGQANSQVDASLASAAAPLAAELLDAAAVVLANHRMCALDRIPGRCRHGLRLVPAVVPQQLVAAGVWSTLQACGALWCGAQPASLHSSIVVTQAGGIEQWEGDGCKKRQARMCSLRRGSYQAGATGEGGERRRRGRGLPPALAPRKSGRILVSTQAGRRAGGRAGYRWGRRREGGRLAERCGRPHVTLRSSRRRCVYQGVQACSEKNGAQRTGAPRAPPAALSRTLQWPTACHTCGAVRGERGCGDGGSGGGARTSLPSAPSLPCRHALGQQGSVP